MNRPIAAAARAPTDQGTGLQEVLQQDRSPWLIALTTGCVYYGGAKLGFALASDAFPLSVLWPPNALLLAMLVLLPLRSWRPAIAAALPAHLWAELAQGIPLTMALAWFVSNLSEALIGALLFKRYFNPARRLNTGRTAVAFLATATIAVVASSFIDAAFVHLVGWRSSGYWELWQARVPSHMLAALMFVPVLLAWDGVALLRWRRSGAFALTEAGTIGAGLLAASLVACNFGAGYPGGGVGHNLLYLPLPFLIWAALRFGPAVSSAGFALVAILFIWEVRPGQGPFFSAVSHQDALPIQLLLISIGVPLVLLSAVVAEHRRTTRRLRVSEALSSAAFKASPDAMVVSSAQDGRVIEANDAWLATYGTQALRGSFQVEAGASNLEVTLGDLQGTARLARVSTQALELEGEAGQLTVTRDITDQRRAEQQARDQRQQLTHLTRVASLTDFSSSLAHELNQPLTAILSNAQAALRFLATDPLNVAEIRSILSEIVEADKRAGQLIHHLRLLMKKGEEEFLRLDVNPLVEQVLNFAHGEFVTRGVQFASSLSPELPAVRGDRVQLQQLLLNLISNACDAMDARDRPDQTLSISTSCGIDGQVLIVVSDNGPGIPAHLLETVFDPFFTTKTSGLGMGLAICRSIAEVHGGRLSAENRSGAGASMRLMLPPAPG